MQASARLRAASIAGALVLIGVVAWVWLGGDEASRANGPDTAGTASSSGQAQEAAAGQGGDAGGTGTGEVVPVEPVRTKAPVPLEGVGRFGTGLTVRLSDVSAVQAEARAPGEIAGPGLRVSVEASNEGRRAVSLDGVVVFVSYGADRTPASQVGSSSDPVRGRLAPGRSRSGSYVYTVPADERDDVRVEVSYTGSAPTVAFSGSTDG